MTNQKVIVLSGHKSLNATNEHSSGHFDQQKPVDNTGGHIPDTGEAETPNCGPQLTDAALETWTQVRVKHPAFAMCRR